MGHVNGHARRPDRLFTLHGARVLRVYWGTAGTPPG
jgi:hypothetical protein